MNFPFGQEDKKADFPQTDQSRRVTADGLGLVGEGPNGQFEVHPKVINFQEDIPFVHNENDFLGVDHNEKIIFLVLFRRLSNKDFLTLFKLFALYTNCVISYLGK